MEKIILIIALAVLPLVGYSQVTAKPMDIPSLELLIKSHKVKYDRLEYRNKNEMKHSAWSITVANVTNKYEEMHKELTTRYSMVSAWGTTALAALNLAKDIKDTFPLLNTFIQQTKHLTNIYVIREYANTIEAINLECKYLSATIKKIPLLRADAQSILEVILELEARVSSINQYLKNCIFMVEGYITLQGIGYKTSIVDKGRIATKIIQDYTR